MPRKFHESIAAGTFVLEGERHGSPKRGTSKTSTSQKKLGAFYTPPEVAESLVRWVVRKPADRLLDPACGDGRLLAAHANSVGVECDVASVVTATQRTRACEVHAADFFTWAEQCRERFDCAAGNPPFIRYQQFSGKERQAALGLCARLGARFSGLASSWAPFLVACASLLKSGGRMAFVVPAEIGHAPYAQPLLSYLADRFRNVVLLAVRRKLFPELSEDVWLLHADGFGGQTDRIGFAVEEHFTPSVRPPAATGSVSLTEWKAWNYRLRPMLLLPPRTRDLYQQTRESALVVPLGGLARVGIGYVTGANDFFHLRPSKAGQLGIPQGYLVPSVRNARYLAGEALTPECVEDWLKRDQPVLLLRLPKGEPLGPTVRKYLDSPAGQEARKTFKCSTRSPWYAVPEVRIPDAFLSYMSGAGPQLVANQARCPCTNSVHAVCLKDGFRLPTLGKMWNHPLARMSCEVEGHPLGGGMLKLEPGECARILLPKVSLRLTAQELRLIEEGIQTMRRWRHYE